VRGWCFVQSIPSWGKVGGGTLLDGGPRNAVSSEVVLAPSLAVKKEPRSTVLARFVESFPYPRKPGKMPFTSQQAFSSGSEFVIRLFSCGYSTEHSGSCWKQFHRTRADFWVFVPR
jgi:hypothetical protein